ncbi:MAG: hypothetical protein RL748_3776 [Pseudomonadota bacterium]|jgi:hypothetical protein
MATNPVVWKMNIAKEPGDSLDVIYIGRGFFEKNNDILQGPKYWARVILHELSHLLCRTDDLCCGDITRYANRGIFPHEGFPARAAIKNADSWAMFGADCAMALTASERRQALRQT